MAFTNIIFKRFSFIIQKKLSGTNYYSFVFHSYIIILNTYKFKIMLSMLKKNLNIMNVSKQSIKLKCDVVSDLIFELKIQIYLFKLFLSFLYFFGTIIPFSFYPTLRIWTYQSLICIERKD
jgi:hypothetical protein